MKRIVSMLLAVLLVVGLTACAGKKDNGGNGGKDSGVEQKYDLKGRVVTIGTWNNEAPDESSANYQKKLEVWTNIEKAYNCKLESLPASDFNSWCRTITTKALANEKIADVLLAPFERIVPQWVNSELVVPIDDYFDFSADYWNQVSNEQWKMNGKHYGISDWHIALGYVILFNKRICAENGITEDQLYEWQEKGEWTWDKFLDVTKKTTKMNSDGRVKSWGFGSSDAYPVSVEPFIYSNGTTPVKINEEFKYTYNLDDPAAIEAIDFCNSLVYEDKVVYPNFDGASTWQNLWERGKIAFFQVPIWQLARQYNAMEDDPYGMLLMPKGPKADDYVNAYSSTSGFFMQPMVEDKKIIGELISDYCKGNVEYYRENNPKEEPAVDIEHYLFDKGSMKTANMAVGRSIELIGGGAAWFRDNVLWTSWGIKEKMPARTFVETKRAPSQKAFDDLWNGKPTVEEPEE